MQTGKHRRIPIVLFGKDFWTKSVGAMIDTFVEHGTVSASGVWSERGSRQLF